MLILLSGVSGAGKDTIKKELIKRMENVESLPSFTDRPERPGDIPGVIYNFVSTEEFERMIAEDALIEYAQYVENYYGTPRAFVEKELAAGKNVILEIEVQGALNIKDQYPDAILIFITAPSVEALKARLIGRGTEEEAVVAKRMKRASEEAEEIDNYEYIVINDDLDECVHNVHSIVVSRRCELKQNLDFIEETKKGFEQI